MDLLMVRRMMVMAWVIVFASLPTTASRGRASPVVAVCVESVLVFDALGLPALLRVHALQPQHVTRIWIVRERALTVLWHRAATRGRRRP